MLDESGVPGRTDPASRRRPAGPGRSSMNGSIHADATGIAHRRGDSGTADAAGCRVRRVSRARRASVRRRPRCLPLHVRFGDGNATAPQAPTAAETGGAHHRRNACALRPTLGRTCRRAKRGKQARADARENRRGQDERGRRRPSGACGPCRTSGPRPCSAGGRSGRAVRPARRPSPRAHALDTASHQPNEA